MLLKKRDRKLLLVGFLKAGVQAHLMLQQLPTVSLVFQALRSINKKIIWLFTMPQLASLTFRCSVIV